MDFVRSVAVWYWYGDTFDCQYPIAVRICSAWFVRFGTGFRTWGDFEGNEDGTWNPPSFVVLSALSIWVGSIDVLDYNAALQPLASKSQYIWNVLRRWCNKNNQMSTFVFVGPDSICLFLRLVSQWMSYALRFVVCTIVGILPREIHFPLIVFFHCHVSANG